MTYYCEYLFFLEEYGRPVYQEYEPIRIKWDGGYMDIVPPGIFEIEDSRKCLNKFKKIVKLSAMSDLTKGTNTISALRKAIKADYDFIFRVSSEMADHYKTLYEDIVKHTSQDEKKLKRGLAHLQKRNTIELKRLDARKQRLQKCAAALEEIAEKYK